MKDRIGDLKTDNHPPETAARRALTLDVERYQSYLDECDLSEDERREFLEALWTVMVGFADLGYEIGPANCCGKADNATASAAASHSPVVELPGTQTTANFNASADAPKDQRE